MSARHKCLSLVSLLLICIAAPGAARAQASEDIRQQIAQAYGLSSFDQVEELRYTFNLHWGKINVARSWVWEVKKDRVSFKGADKQGKAVELNYLRSELNGQPAQQLQDADHNFINDQYWLLFPFHLVWDKAATVEDTGMHKLPLGAGSARRVVVSYPASGGGYTPGDSYELFIGTNNRIVQWSFHRGGAAAPTLSVTWEGYRQLGPLTLSLDHKDAARGTRIWFTDVAVKLAGSDQWLAPK
jgi:hypothetical protein